MKIKIAVRSYGEVDTDGGYVCVEELDFANVFEQAMDMNEDNADVEIKGLQSKSVRICCIEFECQE